MFEIRPPRSWPKDDQAIWRTLPAAIRHRIATREQERDRGLRQKQNDLAQKLKELQPNDEAMPVTTEKGMNCVI
jgi:hypothetical protein